jgi:hypothetical protein
VIRALFALPSLAAAMPAEARQLRLNDSFAASAT